MSNERYIQPPKQKAQIALKLFAYNISEDMEGLINGFPSLKRSINDLNSKLGTKAVELTKADNLLATITEFVKTNSLADALVSLRKWVEIAQATIDATPEDELEARKGAIDTGNVVVTLFGKEASIQTHAAKLLANSELAKLLSGGFKVENKDEGLNLAKLLRYCAKVVTSVIPDEYKQERKSKSKTDESVIEVEETQSEETELEVEDTDDE